MDVVIHVDAHFSGVLDKLAQRSALLMQAGLRVAVVVTDQGVGALKAPFDPAVATLHQLVARGLMIAVCEAGLVGRRLRPEQVPPFCARVPVGVVELVRLQQQGAAYLTVSDSTYA